MKVVYLFLLTLLLSIGNCFSQENTVQIGKQTWMLKNLNVDHYRNGDSIPEVKDPEEWAKLKTGAWCYYNNDPNNGEIYGILYNKYAVNDPRGLAPDGWHVASQKEWNDLSLYCGGEKKAGIELKEAGSLNPKNNFDDPVKQPKSIAEGYLEASKKQGQAHWLIPNLASNKSGFTALPGGERDKKGGFQLINGQGFWYCSGVGCVTLYNSISDISISIICQGNEGKSVRCIKDK